MSHEKSLSETPAIGVSFQHQLTDCHSLVFQSYVPADCSDAMMNEMLDKLSRAGVRQWAVATIRERERHLEIMKGKLEVQTKNLQDVEGAEATAIASWTSAHAQSNRRGEWSPSHQQKQEQTRFQIEKSNHATNIKTIRDDIMQTEIEIAERRKILDSNGE